MACVAAGLMVRAEACSTRLGWVELPSCGAVGLHVRGVYVFLKKLALKCAAGSHGEFLLDASCACVEGHELRKIICRQPGSAGHTL